MSNELSTLLGNWRSQIKEKWFHITLPILFGRRKSRKKKRKEKNRNPFKSSWGRKMIQCLWSHNYTMDKNVIWDLHYAMGWSEGTAPRTRWARRPRSPWWSTKHWPTAALEDAATAKKVETANRNKQIKPYHAPTVTIIVRQHRINRKTWALILALKRYATHERIAPH